VSEILNNRKEITPETATEIAAALGTSPELWLGLQNAYRLHAVRNKPHLTAVQRRAKLRRRLPLGELQKKGWIPQTKDLDLLEAEVCRFLRIGDLDEEPHWQIAARRSNECEETLMPSQFAWIARAASRAETIKVGRFNGDGLERLARELPQRLTEVQGWLAAVGVALVVVEHLQGSKIDGASFRLDNGTPVVALSLRGNRFDSVVFTLVHEIAHILLGHADGSHLVIDEDAASEHPEGNIEQAANQQAQAWLFPVPVNLRAPITQSKVLRAADELGVHPALLIGHLQWKGKLPWSSLRHLIPKAKDLVPFT
jgi:HTH-type transcriptional regulator/antitoxin HigA